MFLLMQKKKKEKGVIQEITWITYKELREKLKISEQIFVAEPVTLWAEL